MTARGLGLSFPLGTTQPQIIIYLKPWRGGRGQSAG